MIRSMSIKVERQGLHDISTVLSELVRKSGVDEGLCTLFIQHTSASLLIQENHDPSARRDLENWLIAWCQRAIRSTPTPSKAPMICRRTLRQR